MSIVSVAAQSTVRCVCIAIKTVAKAHKFRLSQICCSAARIEIHIKFSPHSRHTEKKRKIITNSENEIHRDSSWINLRCARRIAVGKS